MAVPSILRQDLETERLNPRCKPGRAGRTSALAVGLKGRPCLTRECCEAFLKTARKQQHASFFRICCGTGNSLPFIFTANLWIVNTGILASLPKDKLLESKDPNTLRVGPSFLDGNLILSTWSTIYPVRVRGDIKFTLDK